MGALLSALIAIACLGGPASAGAGVSAAAAPPVIVTETSAFLDAFQALNAVDERFSFKDDDDFVAFAQSLGPPALTGTEGRAEAFVSQASSVITGSFSTPFQGVQGIGVSGRVSSKTKKNGNAAPGVPVAGSDGEFSADFGTTAPVPIQFAGALSATNTDPNECSEIEVALHDFGGPVTHAFTASAGGGCSDPEQPANQTNGFVVERRLPPGSYALSAEYDADVVSPEPGDSNTGTAALEVSLAFLPPDTKLTKVKVKARRGKATFKFKSVGKAEGFECALAKKGKKLKFKKCSSPKRYRKLKRGKYTFEARAVGPAGPEATPAKKNFRIR